MTTEHKPDPDHPIIKTPWQYQIVHLTYHIDVDDGHESYLDLHLIRDGVVRRLRFREPQCLKIEEGFPAPTHGMEILDISGRHWERLGVEVRDFEGSMGGIEFLARDVIDLDAPPA